MADPEVEEGWRITYTTHTGSRHRGEKAETIEEAIESVPELDAHARGIVLERVQKETFKYDTKEAGRTRIPDSVVDVFDPAEIGAVIEARILDGD